MKTRRVEKSEKIREVHIAAGAVSLPGDLVVPAEATGIVLFAHGSGSSRKSPRNIYVAEMLRSEGLSTLLFDLLTAREELEDEVDAHLRFDIDLLTHRLVAATDFVLSDPGIRDLNIGYFGASTGAGGALSAAVDRPEAVKAIVSRGGRPDLAVAPVEKVKAPTLLIVGGRDTVVIGLNQRVYDQLRGEKKLAIIPGATHLFEEPGTLEQVGRLATDWFIKYLKK